VVIFVGKARSVPDRSTEGLRLLNVPAPKTWRLFAMTIVIRVMLARCHVLCR
jgi:hypothetical protein